jgi:aspartate/methionine/tyrosine aminotransferase
MKLEPFDLERMQSTYENQVEVNLAESGVHPLRLRELVDDDAGRTAMFAEAICYPQSNGTAPLRDAIASLYPGATRDHIQVTTGGSEANYLTTWNLVDPGDHVVLMVPNYMQTAGLARAFGATVTEWPLVFDGGRWRPDTAALEASVRPNTKLIIICNPNNPTGARLTAGDLDAIAAIASKRGSWILSDEIYRGAERDAVATPSMWGRTDRVLITSGLSKAYGLPGLRIGWIAGPVERVASLWGYHDYTTIAPAALSDFLARRALEPATRSRILARTRAILNENFPVIQAWLDQRCAIFSYAPPEAGAIVYVRYGVPINSTELVTRLRTEQSTLIVPGDHFGMDGYLRIGYGEPADYLRRGLARLDQVVATVTSGTR